VKGDERTIYDGLTRSCFCVCFAAQALCVILRGIDNACLFDVNFPFSYWQRRPLSLTKPTIPVGSTSRTVPEWLFPGKRRGPRRFPSKQRLQVLSYYYYFNFAKRTLLQVLSYYYYQMFEGVCAGELRPIIKERGQIAGVRVEAHHLRLLCIDSERLSSCVCSYFVQHGLHVFRVVGHEAEVICEQHVDHQ